MTNTGSDVVWCLCGVAGIISLLCWSAVCTALSQLRKHRHTPRDTYEAIKVHLRDKYVFARWVSYAIIGTTAVFGGIVSIYDNGTIEGWPAIVVVSAFGLLALSLVIYLRNIDRYDKLVAEHAKALKKTQRNQ